MRVAYVYFRAVGECRALAPRPWRASPPAASLVEVVVHYMMRGALRMRTWSNITMFAALGRLSRTPHARRCPRREPRPRRTTSDARVLVLASRVVFVFVMRRHADHERLAHERFCQKNELLEAPTVCRLTAHPRCAQHTSTFALSASIERFAPRPWRASPPAASLVEVVVHYMMRGALRMRTWSNITMFAALGRLSRTPHARRCPRREPRPRGATSGARVLVLPTCCLCCRDDDAR